MQINWVMGWYRFGGYELLPLKKWLDYDIAHNGNPKPINTIEWDYTWRISSNRFAVFHIHIPLRYVPTILTYLNIAKKRQRYDEKGWKKGWFPAGYVNLKEGWGWNMGEWPWNQWRSTKTINFQAILVCFPTFETVWGFFRILWLAFEIASALLKVKGTHFQTEDTNWVDSCPTSSTSCQIITINDLFFLMKGLVLTFILQNFHCYLGHGDENPGLRF